MAVGFLVLLLQVMMVNVVLSGDNAVVIALAARNLPTDQRKVAILWGSGGAIVLRVALTALAVALLRIPFLQFAGALWLVWIAVKLLVEDDSAEATAQHGRSDLWGAVKTILVADVVMSLDNTLAIAGVAKGNWVLLIVGLALSIPLIVFGSTLIMRVIDRFPIIVYVGAGLIAFTAGEMIDGDRALQPYLADLWRESVIIPAILTAGVIGYGGWVNHVKGRSAHDVLIADERVAERLEDTVD